MKRILTIAASDSGGGAGIQADLKTITLLGEFGMSVVTALTAQNTLSVDEIYPVPVQFIERQIDTVLNDIGADSIKTGMLLNREIVRAVAEKLRYYKISPIIVDPVMKSKSGDTLLKAAAVESMKKELFPLCTVVTPNLDEASLLADMRVHSIESMKKAAVKIKDMGPQLVLITGGHLSQECTDICYDGVSFKEFSHPRINTTNTHGTGCTYAAAIATELAKGLPPFEAIERAKEFVHTAIKFSFPLGRGNGPTNPFAAVCRNAEIWECVNALRDALKKLKQGNIGHLIPEVQSNMGYALQRAEDLRDIVAFPGRIIRVHDSIMCVADPAPGASKHIAKVILTVLKYDRRFRSAMNIRYSSSCIKSCLENCFQIGEFTRAEEPPSVKKQEGSTLEWGTAHVLSQMGSVPDIIFDRGDIGKEPMVRVIGTSPMDVAEKILRIAKRVKINAD